jgi:DNA polymerase-1
MVYRVIMDIEADDLLLEATKTHIIGFKNKDTGEKKYWLEGDLGWIEEFEKIDVFIGHNLAGYDFPLLFKLFGYKPRKSQKIQDTMIMSLVLNYNRYPNGQHRLANWGETLNYPKLEFNDFSKYTPEMHTYWERDLDLNDKVHDCVITEFKVINAKNPSIAHYLRAETAVSLWCAYAELHGWPFDRENGTSLLATMESSLQVVRDKLLPRLGNKIVAVDKANGVVPPKTPKWRKDGAYDAHTCRWFGVDEWSGGDEDRLVEGQYSRIKLEDLDVDSVTDVKIFLFRNGWVPTEYNTKPNPLGRGKINTSPKITEDSLECMDGDGKIYCEFLTTKSRVGILKTWLNSLDSNDNLHGGCFTIGTPSMRARHSLIVNVPAADSVWGPEMRRLFKCKPGWKLIGCDSAGNQARGLAHYLKSDDFTHQLLHGDIHTFNANALDGVLKEMGIDWNKYLISKGVVADAKNTLEANIAKRKRANAKRILYAFLFGASGSKLWSYIFDVLDDKNGNKLKAGFTKAVPGFKRLLEQLESIFGKTKQFGDGYIPGIAGNRIYCNSFHKLLVYLLQACEKATCSAACMLLMERLEDAKIPYLPCIFMHDELDFQVPEEFAEQAMFIGKTAFQDGPKLFGVTIMDGEGKMGKNWYDVH